MILLTSCTNKPAPTITKIVRVKQTLPQELLECKDVVIPFVKTQKDVANFILDLHDGYMDCYLKLQAIKELNDETNISK